jgi:hypothetical protein
MSDDLEWPVTRQEELEHYRKALAERDIEIVQLRNHLRAALAELERWRHGLTIEGDYVCPRDLECNSLRAQLRIAESVRDDARAASQRYLDEMRQVKRLMELQSDLPEGEI